MDLSVRYLDLDLCLALRAECLDLDLDLGLKCLLTTLLLLRKTLVALMTLALDSLALALHYFWPWVVGLDTDVLLNIPINFR